MLTREEVLRQRAVLDQEAAEINKRYSKEQRQLAKRYQALYKECPHEHMNSAPYTRWCCDCGQDWDTT